MEKAKTLLPRTTAKLKGLPPEVYPVVILAGVGMIYGVYEMGKFFSGRKIDREKEFQLHSEGETEDIHHPRMPRFLTPWVRKKADTNKD